jgi:hypothetical protein
MPVRNNGGVSHFTTPRQRAIHTVTRTAAIRVAALAAVALTAIALTGCTGTPGPSSSPSPSSSRSASPNPAVSSSAAASASPSASPSGSSSASPTANPVPVARTCDQLVSRQAMYDFNPNFGLQASFTPKSGSASAIAVAKKGVACSWLNQTSRDTIELSVAHLPAGDIAALKGDLNSSSKATSAFAAPGYFTDEGGVGVAQVFNGSYWVVARSTFFSEAGEATQIVNSAIASLG